MEITFQGTPEDIVSFQKFYARHSNRWPVIIGLLLGVVLSLAPALLDRRLWLRIRLFGPEIVFQQTMRKMLQPAALLATLVPIIFFLVLWFVLIPLSRKAQVKNSPFCRFPQTVRLLEDGVFQSLETGDTLYRWAHVFDVTQTESHLFILVTKETAVIIPKRAFADALAAQRFFEAARNLWRNKQGASPPIPAPPSLG
jgi:hypothetical protein